MMIGRLTDGARAVAAEALCRALHPWLWRSSDDLAESCDACDCAIAAVEEGD